MGSPRLILTCNAAAYPQPSVVWYKDGKNITSNVDIITNSPNTISIINATATPDIAGWYFCQFSTLVGILNSTVANVIYSR